ncbi:hypothetical protein ACIREO_22275 [Streptomyces sp. NPDC102441]|uniref:hypothetical protein n=1 Tax=Streptomyces sp. NPDC102441 TaxID=3366176 RepID=UPI00380BC4CA
MGKASRTKRERRGQQHHTGHKKDAPDIILPSNGEHSLASGYSMGMYTYGKQLVSGQMPEWLQWADPLDLLFIGLSCEPGYLPDDGEYVLANGREAWLDKLRPTSSWEGIEDLVRLMVRFAAERQLPIDSSEFHLHFAKRLAAETTLACRRPLPAELRPARALADSRTIAEPQAFARAVAGRPMADGSELADLLRLAEVDLDVPWDTTPHDALRLGMRRLRHWSMPSEIVPAMALFAGIHGFDDQDAADFPAFGVRASAWLTGIPEGTPFAELADTVCAGVAERHAAADVLREMLAMPQATLPVPEEDWTWRSSAGLAAVREATALGLSPLTRRGQIIPMDPVQDAIMAALEDEQEAMSARSTQRDVFGRALPDDGWFAQARRLAARETVAPPRFSAATAHATEYTGLMPPFPAGFPDPEHQKRWDEAVAEYCNEHPDTEHDARIEGLRRAQQMLAFETFVAHRHPRLGQAVVAELLAHPNNWRADMLVTGFPCDAADELAQPVVRARLDELARAFDVTASSIDAAVDLVAANPSGLASLDSQQSARPLTPALFCALTVVLHAN